MEDLVRKPSAYNSARNSREFVSRICPSHRLDVYALLRKQRRSPVQTTVAHHIYKSISQGDEPKQLVVQDIFEENLLRGKRLLLLLRIVLRIIITPRLDRLKPARLRSVTKQHIGKNGHQKRHGSRESKRPDKEVKFGVIPVEPASEPDRSVRGHDSNQAAAYVMGTIPDAHLGPALSNGEPMRHDPAAWRPAHPVEPADQRIQNAHHQNGHSLVPGADILDGNNHEAHGDCCQHESERKERPGIRTVAHAAHQKLRKGICGRIQTKDKAQLSFLEAKRCEERNGQRQVFAHEIETGIAYESSQKYLEAQSPVFRICLRAGLGRLVRRLLQESQHYLTISISLSG